MIINAKILVSNIPVEAGPKLNLHMTLMWHSGSLMNDSNIFSLGHVLNRNSRLKSIFGFTLIIAAGKWG